MAKFYIVYLIFLLLHVVGNGWYYLTVMSDMVETTLLTALIST